MLLTLCALAVSDTEDNFESEAFDVQFPDEGIYDSDAILRYLYFTESDGANRRRRRSSEESKRVVPQTITEKLKEGKPTEVVKKIANESEEEEMEPAELVFRPFFPYSRGRFGYRRPFGGAGFRPQFGRPFPVFYG